MGKKVLWKQRRFRQHNINNIIYVYPKHLRIKPRKIAENRTFDLVIDEDACLKRIWSGTLENKRECKRILTSFGSNPLWAFFLITRFTMDVIGPLAVAGF